MAVEGLGLCGLDPAELETGDSAVDTGPPPVRVSATDLGGGVFEGVVDATEYQIWTYLSLSQAAEVHPDQWVGWYNLACEQAKAGQRDAAFASLDRAVAAGMKDQKLAAGDADLASLHADPRFAAFLARLSPPIR